jgi:hypothetical protein
MNLFDFGTTKSDLSGTAACSPHRLEPPKAAHGSLFPMTAFSGADRSLGCSSRRNDTQHDIVHGMSLPTPTHNHNNLHRVPLQDVLNIVAEIDDILLREFGGRGRGIHSKLDSVHPPLPARLDRRLRYFEAVRNKALMQPDWRIPDRTGYVAECQAAARRLHHIAHMRARRRNVLGSLQRLGKTRWSVATVVAALCMLYLVTSRVFFYSG